MAWNVDRNGTSLESGIAVQIQENVSGKIPLPKGEGGPEGPGEGCKDSPLHPSPAASRHPLPSGEGFENASIELEQPPRPCPSVAATPPGQEGRSRVLTFRDASKNARAADTL